MNDLFSSEKAVCIFPAGLVSRRIKGEVQDLEWKKTFITYARRNGQPVVPVYIDGQLSPFFYRLANFRKFIGIKTNIEMLYLSDELFLQRNKTIRFVIGEALTVSSMGAGGDKELASKMRAKVYELKRTMQHIT
jgi:putative hemolysin